MKMRKFLVDDTRRELSAHGTDGKNTDLSESALRLYAISPGGRGSDSCLQRSLLPAF